MTITLPDDVREQAERQVKAAGFASVSDYLADLVREDDETGTPPDSLSGYTYEELGKLLDAAKVGPWVPADEAFWEERHRKLAEFVAKQGLES